MLGTGILLALIFIGMIRLMLWPVFTVIKSFKSINDPIEINPTSKPVTTRRRPIVLDDDYDYYEEEEVRVCPTQSSCNVKTKGSWTYNPNIHLNIHDELSLSNALSHPGKSFIIETGYFGTPGSPILNSSSYRNVGGNHRLVEREQATVYGVRKFREGHDEGFEITYVNSRGCRRTGRFYFSTNGHCSYSNFIYRMEEI